MNSPITGRDNVSLERKIPSAFIIQNYLESYGIDVSRLFRNNEDVEIYRCADSNFRFYGPSQVAGDSEFYADLQQFPWYYMDWKWEHQVVSEDLSANFTLLEIGCAEGAFIKRLAKEVTAVGLELNDHAAAHGVEQGLDIRTETIQEHALAHVEAYDVVCSFQVMEHVTDVKGIIEASVKALKPGGQLIISVPNNDSFIKYSPNSILNMPPHHMCLWDEGSLRKLEDYFDIEFLEFKKEPLQQYHYAVVVNNFIERRIGKGFIGKVFKKLSKITGAYKVIGLFKNKILGHSIIAYYRKKK